MRYCFVLMPFGEMDPIFDGAISPAISDIGLECRRADDIHASGQALLEKIDRQIREAAIVVADVTGANPNVLYEVGYARALGKHVVLITQDSPADIVSNLRGLEVLQYSSARKGLDQLKQGLKAHVAALLRDATGYLRDMLEPPDGRAAYIVVSPLGGTRSRFPPPRNTRTYGDYLGVVGIIRAYGMMFGERRMPEVLDSRIADPEVVRSNNVYVIGSFKANHFEEDFLQGIQEGRAPTWRFLRRGEDKEEDFEVILTGHVDGKQWTWRTDNDPSFSEDPSDYGLVVRSPHPFQEGKMAMILAGPHSRGTGAACMAATDSSLIGQIADMFAELSPPHTLDDKSKAIWILVKGKRSGDRRTLVTIERVGLYC